MIYCFYSDMCKMCVLLKEISSKIISSIDSSLMHLQTKLWIESKIFLLHSNCNSIKSFCGCKKSSWNKKSQSASWLLKILWYNSFYFEHRINLLKHTKLVIQNLEKVFIARKQFKKFIFYLLIKYQCVIKAFKCHPT